MVDYIIDLLIVAVLIIAITATNGVMANAIGLKIFGGKSRSSIVDQSKRIQTDWKNVGGIKK